MPLPRPHTRLLPPPRSTSPSIPCDRLRRSSTGRWRAEGPAKPSGRAPAQTASGVRGHRGACVQAPAGWSRLGVDVGCSRLPVRTRGGNPAVGQMGAPGRGGTRGLHLFRSARERRPENDPAAFSASRAQSPRGWKGLPILTATPGRDGAVVGRHAGGSRRVGPGGGPGAVRCAGLRRPASPALLWFCECGGRVPGCRPVSGPPERRRRGSHQGKSWENAPLRGEVRKSLRLLLRFRETTVIFFLNCIPRKSWRRRLWASHHLPT